MGHIHSIYDTDKHFSIDLASRELRKSDKDNKMTVMQYDHRSEHITFDIPKMIETHNLLDCNVVEVHFLNIDAKTNKTNPGLHKITDLDVSKTDDSIAVCSWEIWDTATQLAGSLWFRITFKCVKESGIVDFRWSTAIYKGLFVADGINNTDYVVERSPDVIAQLEAQLDAIEQAGGSGYTLPVATAEKLGGVKAVAATEEMTEEVGIDAEGKLKVKPGGAGDGLSSEEKTLILSLFKNAAYTADMSATIAQLESMWSGGTVEPDVPDDPDVGISQVGSILTISGVADITKVAQSGTVLTMT